MFDTRPKDAEADTVHPIREAAVTHGARPIREAAATHGVRQIRGAAATHGVGPIREAAATHGVRAIPEVALGGAVITTGMMRGTTTDVGVP